MKKYFIVALVLAATQLFAGSAHATGNVPLSGWGWSSTIGWVSFDSINASSYIPYGVTISTTTDAINGTFDGYAWSSNIGWISFKSTEVSNACTSHTGGTINLSTGAVSGWAVALSGISRTDGWDGCIELAGTNHPSLPGNDTTGGVYLDLTASPHVFKGKAWGDTNVGWLSFTGVSCAGCVSAPPIPTVNNCEASLTHVPPAGGNVIFTASASGGSGVYTYSWDGTGGPNPYTRFISTGNPSSPLVRATDNAGHVSSPYQCPTVTVDTILATTTSCTADRTTLPVGGGNVIFTAPTPTGGFSPYHYYWNGNTAQSQPSTRTSYYANTTSTPVTLVITDSAPIPQSITVNSCPGLVVTMGSPCTVIPTTIAGGGTVRFYATSTTGGQKPYSYFWDNSASSTASSTSTTTPNVAGTFSGLQLRITDSAATVQGISPTCPSVIVTAPPFTLTSECRSDFPQIPVGGDDVSFYATNTTSTGTGIVTPYHYFWTVPPNPTPGTEGDQYGGFTNFYDTTATIGAILTVMDSSPTPKKSNPINCPGVTMAQSLSTTCTASPSTTAAGGGDVLFTAHPAGGKPTYRYYWGGSAVANQFSTTSVHYSGNGAGVALRVGDAYGNNASTTCPNITVPTLIVSDCTSPSPIAYPGEVTRVVFNASSTTSGGTPPYFYNWTLPPGYSTIVAYTTSYSRLYSVASSGPRLTVLDSASPQQSRNFACPDVTNGVIPMVVECTSPGPQVAASWPLDLTYTASSSGGSGGYTYSWDSGSYSAPSTYLRSVGAVGTYHGPTLMARDSNASTSAMVTCADVSVTTSIIPMEASCTSPVSPQTVASFPWDLTFTASSTGGSGGYTYSWDSGAYNASPTYIRTTQATGTYQASFRAKDSTGSTTGVISCTPVTVEAPVVPLTWTGSCTADRSSLPYLGGNVVFTAPTPVGGTGGYHYYWEGSGTANQLSSTSKSYIVSGPGATLRITDSAATPHEVFPSCPAVTVGPQMIGRCTVDPTSIVGAGIVTFYATSTTGGVGPYSYYWNHSTTQGGVTSATTTTNDDYTLPGFYLKIVDSFGTTVTPTCPSVSVYHSGGPIMGSCTSSPSPAFLPYGGGDVTFTASTTGGNPPFRFFWGYPTVGTPLHLPGLIQGGLSTVTHYTSSASGTPVHVMDIFNHSSWLGCPDVTVASLFSGGVCVASRTTLPIGGGSVVFTARTPTGGATPYHYYWNNSAIEGLNMISKNYTVSGNGPALSINDSFGATLNPVCPQITVAQPVVLPLTIQCTSPVSPQIAASFPWDLTFTATSTGGSGGYTYSWNSQAYSSATTTIGQASIPGQYVGPTVSVKDSTGSTTAALQCNNVTVVAPVSGTCTSVPVNPRMPALGPLSVQFTANPTGGSGSYSYYWGNPGILGSISSTTLYTAAGQGMPLRIVDSLGLTFTPSCPPVLPYGGGSLSGYCITPQGGPTPYSGVWSASVSGGTAPYTYSWDGGTTYGLASTSVVSDSVGPHTGPSLRIKDSNNVTFAASPACGQVVVTQPPPGVTRTCTPGPGSNITGEYATYTATSNNLNGPITYDWGDGKSYVATSTHTYYVAATTTNPVQPVSHSVSIRGYIGGLLNDGTASCADQITNRTTVDAPLKLMIAKDNVAWINPYSLIEDGVQKATTTSAGSTYGYRLGWNISDISLYDTCTIKKSVNGKIDNLAPQFPSPTMLIKVPHTETSAVNDPHFASTTNWMSKMHYIVLSCDKLTGGYDTSGVKFTVNNASGGSF